MRNRKHFTRRSLGSAAGLKTPAASHRPLTYFGYRSLGEVQINRALFVHYSCIIRSYSCIMQTKPYDHDERTKHVKYLLRENTRNLRKAYQQHNKTMQNMAKQYNNIAQHSKKFKHKQASAIYTYIYICTYIYMYI